MPTEPPLAARFTVPPASARLVSGPGLAMIELVPVSSVTRLPAVMSNVEGLDELVPKDRTSVPLLKETGWLPSGPVAPV